MEIWLWIRIKARWLMPTINAHKETSQHAHFAAAHADHPDKAKKLRDQADLHEEAHEGFKVAQKRFEDDHE